MLNKETLKKVLHNAADAIDTGNSDYSESELSEILETINTVTNTKKKLSKEQSCKYLGISRATFDNYVREGKLPRGKKELGFKELFWELHTLKQFKNGFKDKHST